MRRSRPEPRARDCGGGGGRCGVPAKRKPRRQARRAVGWWWWPVVGRRRRRRVDGWWMSTCGFSGGFSSARGCVCVGEGRKSRVCRVRGARERGWRFLRAASGVLEGRIPRAPSGRGSRDGRPSALRARPTV